MYFRFNVKQKRVIILTSTSLYILIPDRSFSLKVPVILLNMNAFFVTAPNSAQRNHIVLRLTKMFRRHSAATDNSSRLYFLGNAYFMG